MPELTRADAVKLIFEYYNQRFKPEDAVKVVVLLGKIDIDGLVIYAFNAGVSAERQDALYANSRASKD